MKKEPVPDSPPPKTKVLLELRPAFEGYAGIPQETRLLFRHLRTFESLEVEGLLQTSHRVLARGIRQKRPLFSRPLSQARQVNRYSRVVISTIDKPYKVFVDKASAWVQKKVLSITLSILSLLRINRIELTNFKSTYFSDYVWRTLFSKTLPASDYDVVSTADMKVCPEPWHYMHLSGLNTLTVSSTPIYPRLDTRGIDVFIAQTPYPGKPARGTAFVVRYHDALPVLMPHTISDKAVHQATHFYALTDNVKNGAWFACVSDATRTDLLKLFPELGDRAVTIHNVVSPHYYREDSPAERVPQIIRARLYASDPNVKDTKEFKDYRVGPKFLSLREQEHFYRRALSVKPFRYLLVVSTIEPRKNHSRLLAAWEMLKAEVEPDLKLVVVGTLGWDYRPFLKVIQTWLERGEAFMLNDVPSPDLRVLYRHAAATICPSLGEGFDFSGVEAMRSGGIAIASDIPVHREIYEDAAEYFNPYSTMSLAQAVKRVLHEPGSEKVRQRLLSRGEEVAARYVPEKILPQWQQFLDRVTRRGESAAISLPVTSDEEPAAVSRLS